MNATPTPRPMKYAFTSLGHGPNVFEKTPLDALKAADGIYAIHRLHPDGVTRDKMVAGPLIEAHCRWLCGELFQQWPGCPGSGPIWVVTGTEQARAEVFRAVSQDRWFRQSIYGFIIGKVADPEFYPDSWTVRALHQLTKTALVADSPAYHWQAEKCDKAFNERVTDDFFRLSTAHP